ncbi:hypothetical protein L7F22_030303 [Adiantum nelumboides]|nr:hypothetical protein [Adiantum nelumboides]
MQDCRVPYTTSLYNDDKACAEMVYCMAKYLMDFTLKKVSSSRWFGVMIDESTDISTHGHMVIYLSYLEDECIPKMSFYGIVRVCDGTAKSLFNAVIDELKRCKLDLSKLIAFGSDGCSTMTGKKNGVSSLLKKNVNPFLTSIHCVAHRSALAVSSVAKSMDACKKLDKLVNSLATFYNGSSKRLKELQEMQEDLACPILRLQHTYDIRWLSRYNALNALCLSFDAILKLSRKDNLPLFNEISNFQFIYSLFFMTDILKGLATLSKTFQRDHVDVTSVKSLVDNQISRIKEYYIEDPKLDCNALTHGIGGFEILQEYGSPKGHLFTLREALRGNMFYDQEIKRDICGEDLRNALEFQFSFASAIITNLECRFEDNTILNNMKVFVPAQFPLLERALKVFGNVEFENLAKFYGKKQRIGILDFDPIIDGDDLKNEFKTFKNQAPKDFVRYSLTEVTSCIASNVMWRDEYPNLLTLCQVALVQCSSIAMCERGFSARTIIKSNIRNRLEIKSLDALMKIAIEGPPTLSEDELLESIEMWSEKAHRHLFTSQVLDVVGLAAVILPQLATQVVALRTI